MNTDICPISGDNHKYFMFKTSTEFEPAGQDVNHRRLYVRNEYAILGCNCSSVVKSKIKESDNE